MSARIGLARGATLGIAMLAMGNGCADRTVRPSPPAPPGPTAPAPPETPRHEPEVAPRHVDATASDPWGRRENITVSDDALQSCLRDAKPGASGWVLLRVDFEVLPRPARVAIVDREGLDEGMTACLVAAFAAHDELEHLAATRFVYVAAQ